MQYTSLQFELQRNWKWLFFFFLSKSFCHSSQCNSFYALKKSIPFFLSISLYFSFVFFYLYFVLENFDIKNKMKYICLVSLFWNKHWHIRKLYFLKKKTKNSKTGKIEIKKFKSDNFEKKTRKKNLNQKKSSKFLIL